MRVDLILNSHRGIATGTAATLGFMHTGRAMRFTQQAMGNVIPSGYAIFPANPILERKETVPVKGAALALGQTYANCTARTALRSCTA